MSNDTQIPGEPALPCIRPGSVDSNATLRSTEVLADANTVFAEVKRPKGATIHILTDPIYVEGADPGDTLEVRVLDIKFQVPYAVKNTGPGKGVLPRFSKQPSVKLFRIDLGSHIALFSDAIEIPLNPFMGIMAVSPPTSLGMVSPTDHCSEPIALLV
jgi:acetamidase/formamidase